MHLTNQHALLTYFALVSMPAARAVFLVRPFLKGPIRIEAPKHNFWPYVPVSAPSRGENETSYFKKPDHNFWPYVPVRSPHLRPNSTYFDVPRHNFWPFIPVVPPRTNRTKPIPVTPPVPRPTVPRPESGKTGVLSHLAPFTPCTVRAVRLFYFHTLHYESGKTVVLSHLALVLRALRPLCIFTPCLVLKAVRPLYFHTLHLSHLAM